MTSLPVLEPIRYRGAAMAVAAMAAAARCRAALAAAAGTAPVPPGIGRVPARQLARRELARSIFQVPWWQRAEHAIARWLARLTGYQGPRAVDWWSLIAIAVAVVVAIAAVRHLAATRGLARRQRAGGVLAGTRLSAADHRRNSGLLADDGDYAAAIVERVRAIAVDLETRGILPPRPGRTATELAAEAAGPLPGSAAALRATALLFDDVRYGGRDGTAAGYESVRRLDEAIGATPLPVVSR